MINKPFTAIVLFLFMSFVGCKKEQETNWTYQVSKLKFSYIQTARLSLQNAKSSMNYFYDKASFFNSVPTEYAMNNCRGTWQTAYLDYLLLGPFQYSNPLCDAGFEEYRKYFDVSPINYGYIDYTSSNPNSGLINDFTNYPQGSALDIYSLHQSGSLQNATIGFHVLEFLLWGEDNSLSSTNLRSNTEFQNTNDITIRRKQVFLTSSYYLKTNISLLSFDSNYESAFKKLSPKQTMEVILGGLKRFIKEDIIAHNLQTPLNSQSHLDELSDFSDLTLNHIKNQIQSIKNVYDGRNLINSTENSDYYLIDLIEEINPEHNVKIQAELIKIDAAFDAIPVNFENAILNPSYRAKLNEVISALNSIYSELELFQGNFK